MRQWKGKNWRVLAVAAVMLAAGLTVSVSHATDGQSRGLTAGGAVFLPSCVAGNLTPCFFESSMCSTAPRCARISDFGGEPNSFYFRVSRADHSNCSRHVHSGGFKTSEAAMLSHCDSFQVFI
jgi:hypothetical protein